jgi:hypothetical protein
LEVDTLAAWSTIAGFVPGCDKLKQQNKSLGLMIKGKAPTIS